MCMCACKLTEGITQTPFTLFFLRVFYWPQEHQEGWAGCPVSPMDLPVFASPELGLQVYATTFGFFLMWVLGTKLN